MTDFYSNYAVGDTKRRRGKKAFTNEKFYDLSERLKGQYQAFSTYLSYGEEFIKYVEEQGWSVRGWSGETPAYFTDFPVDFDASDNLDLAYEHCRNFVQNELINRGIDTRYFVIYLSGGKGFHVHISSACLNLELPTPNAGFRLKTLVAGWKQDYPSLDLSVYSSTSLFRLPGSLHKSGLYKTEISWENFNLDHLAARGIWASKPPSSIRVPELGRPPLLIDLPEFTPTITQLTYSAEIDFDENARITPACKWLQAVLEDPSSKGKDGDGRDKRRNAVGILLSAHETSEHNPELQWFVGQLENNDYMDDFRMSEVHKWVREYDRDGDIKCKKTCYSVGCPAAQRKKCGTKSPLDWKLKKRKLELTSIEDARNYTRDQISEILQEDDNGIYVVDFPVGIGKTYTLINKIKDMGLTAFFASQTHRLGMQTYIDFLDKGLTARHIASRTYLAEEDGFECLMPAEVEMAMGNAYGSHTICGTCPRKRKSHEGQEGLEPDEGYDPCDYWEQFEGLKDVDVVVGVHNHLFEFMYEAAAVAARSVTVIDESPLEAFGQTISPIDPAKLDRLRVAMDSEVDRLEGILNAPVKAKKGGGMFARVAAVMEADLARAQHADDEARLQLMRVFRNIFSGQAFDFERLTSMSTDHLRASWFDAAGRLAEITGMADEYELPEEYRYLCIPFPVQFAIRLALRNIVYNPEVQNYLPVRLPPNKILILDATANNDAYAPVIANLTRGEDGRPYRFVPHPLVEQPYSHVTQITSSSYGVSALHNEDTRVYILSVIKELMKQNPGKSLIVCHKQHSGFWRSMFANDNNVHIGTYGALKGLNNWADATAQYIVGTPFVPDHGIRELGAKLGHDVPLHELEASANLKRVMMLAKNGNTAVISRRFYKGFPFHSAIAQMRSQWEVTQAVRLRLYNNTTEFKQKLYIFSNVDLKGMYADEYCTLSELAFEITKTQKSEGRKELEVKGVAYEQITAWFDELPKGEVFVKNNIPEFSGDRYIQYWIQMAIDAGWIEKLGTQRKYLKLL